MRCADRLRAGHLAPLAWSDISGCGATSALAPGVRCLARLRLEESGERDRYCEEGDCHPQRCAESGYEGVRRGVDAGPVEDGCQHGDAEDAAEFAEGVVGP